ncbi:hypothetical protein [Aureitalea marina]|nr:hypothetical protein [Aureitalea marina]
MDVFRNKILTWYNQNGRNFYWRRKSISKYQKVLVEVLLQRTKAETVAKLLPGFISSYPSWRSIANTELSALEDALKPFGLYRQRAKRLHSLSVEMVSRNGRLPRDYNSLIAIPMIGQYIAYSIMSVIHDQPYPMLDVNMARVLERYFGKRKKADIRYDPYLQELAFELVNIENSRQVNWAALDFAALICKARNPKCDECNLKNSCLYYLKE